MGIQDIVTDDVPRMGHPGSTARDDRRLDVDGTGCEAASRLGGEHREGTEGRPGGTEASTAREPRRPPRGKGTDGRRGEHREGTDGARRRLGEGGAESGENETSA